MRKTLIIFAVALLATGTVGCEESEETTDQSEQQGSEQPDEQTEDEHAGDEQPDEHTDDEHAGDIPDEADDLEPGETAHYGEDFTIDDDPITLGEAVAMVEDAELDEESETIKVETDIERVCQNRGCWFTLADDEIDTTVRVRMQDYGFLVARNTEDAEAVVEGTIRRTEVEEELAQHYAEDVAEETGEDPEEIEGPQEEYKFVATGVSMTRPES